MRNTTQGDEIMTRGRAIEFWETKKERKRVKYIALKENRPESIYMETESPTS